MIGVSGDGDLDGKHGPEPAASAAAGGPDSREAQPPRTPFVREAQCVLHDLGYYPGPIDGTFGPRTRMALERYQLAEKLPVTGQLDAETLARLDVYRRLFRPSCAR